MGTLCGHCARANLEIGRLLGQTRHEWPSGQAIIYTPLGAILWVASGRLYCMSPKGNLMALFHTILKPFPEQ